MNYYAEAITIIQGTEDYRALIYEIAKHNPSPIVSANKRLNPETWKDDVKEFIKSQQLIKAIKLYREKKDLALKNQKRHVI